MSLQRVAQDGMRVRAAAGAASFRRKDTRDRCLREAAAQVQALKTEREADGAVGSRWERAVREWQERVERARRRVDERQARQEKAKDNGKKKSEPRASTTDPEATVMKMADGGFRPALNVQFA